MPFDPLSAGVAGAGLLLNFIQGQQDRRTAAANQAFQRQQLAQALSEATGRRSAAMAMAGGLRLDQFGNATYYDPAKGMWVTSFSPTQQRIIDEGQARQRRAQIRGAQASEDYDRLRAEYLYRQPKTEAQSYQEIVDLINQAQGTGERALNTLMNRYGIRTRGNIPVIEQMDRGPGPGQQLAETMLKARAAALDEYSKRQAERTSRLLPALKQFESTANLVAPIDPTGQEIIGMQQQGAQNLLRTGSDYDRLLATIATSGARAGGGTIPSTGPKASDFLAFAKMLAPEKEAAVKGTTGGTRGARASTAGGGDEEDAGTALANLQSYGIVRRYGDRGPVLRGLTLGGKEGPEAAPYGSFDEAVAAGGPDVTRYPNMWEIGGGPSVPYTGLATIGAPIYDFGEPKRNYNPWSF